MNRGGETMLQLLLDTNVVLDWLVFADPQLQWLDAPSEIRIVGHTAAFAELERVLNYPQLHLEAERQQQILQRYRHQTSALEVPAAPLPAGFPQCRDGDDQHFIEAGYLLRVDALVSRDRQVLKLRKRAAKFGLRIIAVPELAMLCPDHRCSLSE